MEQGRVGDVIVVESEKVGQPTRSGEILEVLGEGDAWPIGQDEGPEAYVQAIREVLSDPTGARQRGRALRQRMLGERTPQDFEILAADVLLNGPTNAGTDQ
jgi:glycosyltransferase involved in cell wall biosynthesis